MLFAPSLPLILYGIVAEAPIDELFVAGVLPGVLMIVMLSGVQSAGAIGTCRACVRRGRMRDVWAAIREARWDLPLPFVVLGGIYSGYFAVSEAAAVTALYVTVVEVVILREIPWRDLPRIMRESMVLVGAILVILGVSLASTNYMIDAGVPQQLFALVSQYVTRADHVSSSAARVPAYSRRDSRHLLGDCVDRAAAAAGGRRSTASVRFILASRFSRRWSSAI